MSMGGSLSDGSWFLYFWALLEEESGLFALIVSLMCVLSAIQHAGRLATLEAGVKDMRTEIMEKIGEVIDGWKEREEKADKLLFKKGKVLSQVDHGSAVDNRKNEKLAKRMGNDADRIENDADRTKSDIDRLGRDLKELGEEIKKMH